MSKQNVKHFTSSKRNGQATPPQTGNDLDALLADLFVGSETGQIALPSGSKAFLDEYFLQESDRNNDEPLFVFDEQRNGCGNGIGGGVGALRGNRAADPVDDSQHLGSPITNRGASTYQSDSQTPLKTRQLGGYDGGAEVGFEGIWDSEKFPALLAKLEAAKQTAAETSRSCETSIGGHPILVEPTGANIGMHYRYLFTLDGVRFFIHHNPPKNRQGVRIRYSADALIGRSLFALHRTVLEFLRELGFLITDEKISRIDMQVLVECKVLDLIRPILDGHDVCKARNFTIHGKRKKPETYTVGSADSVQLCIYDKKAELKKEMVGDPVKFRLMIDHCIGEEWFFSNRPITRVEFRLRRDALREMDIHTVQDLQERETALTEWLSDKWFRLLESPKVRGHENTAAVHPLWENVQQLFRQWFPGVVDDNKPVAWRRSDSVSCDSTALTKQAVGCLAKVAALQYGAVQTVERVLELAHEIIRGYGGVLCDKVVNCARRVEIRSGVRLGKDSVVDEVRGACATVIDPARWMGVPALALRAR